jgi:GNAT superfamily N-acetyltransferase
VIYSLACNLILEQRSLQIVMKKELAIHLIRKVDLEAGDCYGRWEDPENLAPLSQCKRQALLNNPLATRDDDAVQLIGTCDNRVIGQVDLIRGELMACGQPVPLYYASRLFVAESYRDTGIGLRLFREMYKLAPTVAVCGVSQMAYPLYCRLGWVDFDLPRYILLRRSRPVIERFVGKGPPAALLAPLADVCFGLQRTLASVCYGRLKGLRVELVDKADEELDALLRKHVAAFGAHRSAAWLNWLLNHCFQEEPHNRQKLCVIRDTAGTLLAYFLVKVRFYPVASQQNIKNLLLGSLQDWLIFAPERLSYRQLLITAVRILGNAGVQAVEVCGPDTIEGSGLRMLGFVRVGSLHFMFKPNVNSPLSDKKYHQQSAWRIRPGEGDNFFA